MLAIYTLRLLEAIRTHSAACRVCAQIVPRNSCSNVTDIWRCVFKGLSRCITLFHLLKCILPQTTHPKQKSSEFVGPAHYCDFLLQLLEDPKMEIKMNGLLHLFTY